MVTDNQARTIYNEAIGSGRAISDVAKSFGFDPAQAHSAITKMRNSEVSEADGNVLDIHESKAPTASKKGRPAGSAAAKKVVAKAMGAAKVHWATKAAQERRLLRAAAPTASTKESAPAGAAMTAAVLQAFAKHAAESKKSNMSYAEAVGLVMGAIDKTA